MRFHGVISALSCHHDSRTEEANWIQRISSAQMVLWVDFLADGLPVVVVD